MNKFNPRTCTFNDCARPLLCKGLCSLHYQRARSGFYMNAPLTGSLSMEDRFWSFVSKTDGCCWIWTGGKDKNGYGIFTHRNRSYRATRLAWELTNGSIGSRLMACHSCDNPPCVNPSHLFLGSGKDNAADMIRKGRYKNGRAVLSKEVAQSIRSGFTGKYGEVARLSRQYGIAHSQMWEICHGKSWMDRELAIIDARLSGPARSTNPHRRILPTPAAGEGHPVATEVK